MALSYNTPGVYRQEIFLKSGSRLLTGVPGFIGFVNTVGQSGPDFNTPVALHRKEEFATYFGSQTDSYLDAALTGFFANGGRHCYVVGADPGGDRMAALQRALAALALLDDLDLVAIPDAMSLSHDQSLQV